MIGHLIDAMKYQRELAGREKSLTSVTKLCTNPLMPPFSRIDVLSRMKKNFKFPRYLTIFPFGTYVNDVISTPYRSRASPYHSIASRAKKAKNVRTTSKISINNNYSQFDLAKCNTKATKEFKNTTIKKIAKEKEERRNGERFSGAHSGKRYRMKNKFEWFGKG